MDQDQKIITLLAGHEDLLAKLYEKYSEIFPDIDFWKSLVKDEIIHRQWLLTIAGQTKKRGIVIDQDRFPEASLQTSIEYVQKLIANAQSHSLLNALSYALDLEKALIEKKYFEVFKTDSKDVLNILEAIIKMTKEHIQKVQEELDEKLIETDIAAQH